jgi:adenylyltransferase/sulfurtransferase
VFNFNGSATYRDAFPGETVRPENCNEIGVLGVLPGIVGAYQALEAVKIITGFGESLAGKLLVIDAANMEHHVFHLSNKKRTLVPSKPMRNHLLTWQDVRLLDPADHHFIDVRDPSVYQTAHDSLFENVPMKSLTEFAPQKTKVVLVCQMGVTTQQAAAILQSKHPELTIFQVKGGYNAR